MAAAVNGIRMMRVIPVVCTGAGSHAKTTRCGRIELEPLSGPIEALDILSGNWVMRVRVFDGDESAERPPHATYRFTCHRCDPPRNEQVTNVRLTAILRRLAANGVHVVRALDIANSFEPLS